MAIRGNLPKHLEVAARTGVLVARPNLDMPWRQVAMDVNLTASSTTFVDFGGNPLPTQSPKVVQDIIEKGMTVTPEDWYLTVSISQNAIDDDQTGTAATKFRSVIDSYEKHINQKVFEVLNAGDGQTISAAYDGQDFFDSDHVDDGASYQTVQDNENTLALSIDNFETVYVLAQQYRDDQGNFTNYAPDLIVCSPSGYRTAVQITGNQNAYDTGNNEINPYYGLLKRPISSPYLDSGAWYLLASSESVKPLFVAMRKRPQLNGEPWFDPQQEDGGMWYFPYHGRYVVGYGDWRLATQGQT